MGQADWEGVCRNMKLAGGVFWPIPITLSVDQDVADGLAEGDEIALVAEHGRDDGHHEGRGEVRHRPRLRMRARLQDHRPGAPGREDGHGAEGREPGRSGEGAQRRRLPDRVRRASTSGPAESRAVFAERGWKTIAALQLRNPMHRSHEYLAKIALETLDGLYIHQLVGGLKPGDIPADVRVKCIDALVDNYFIKDSVLQGGYPLDMRYAGPREGLLHGVFRQNFGCTHMIIGRDHAGVGDYYGPFDAQNIWTRDSRGRAGDPDAAHRLDLLVLQVRRHDQHEDLPARQGRPPVPQRHRPAQGAERGRRRAGRVLAARGAGDPAGVLRGPRATRTTSR